MLGMNHALFRHGLLVVEMFFIFQKVLFVLLLDQKMCFFSLKGAFFFAFFFLKIAVRGLKRCTQKANTNTGKCLSVCISMAEHAQNSVNLQSVHFYLQVSSVMIKCFFTFESIPVSDFAWSGFLTRVIKSGWDCSFVDQYSDA